MNNLATIIFFAVIIFFALGTIGIIFATLYKRSTKEVAFVRTGMGGQKVIMDGGAIVLPVFHERVLVNMNTLKLEVQRRGKESLITRDRMRVDVTAAFFVRVKQTEEAVSIAAQTLGARTMSPDELKALVEDKFVDSLRATAATMSIQELQDKRRDFVQAVQNAVAEDLEKNGLELEAVSLTSLDQTDKQYFNPDNAFDAEGLTRLTEQTEARRKQRNDVEQDTEVQVRTKNLDATRQKLTIEKDQEFATLSQQREIENTRAEQAALIATQQAERSREAEVAKIEAERQVSQQRIEAEREIRSAEIEKKLVIETREIEMARKTETQKAEQQKLVEVARQEAQLAIIDAEKQVSQQKIEAEREIRASEIEKNLVIQSREIEMARKTETQKAEQQKLVEVARQEAQLAIIDAEKQVSQQKIEAEREIRASEIEKNLVIQTREIELERNTETQRAEQRKQVEIARQAAQIAIANKSREQSEADAAANLARAQAVKADEAVTTARQVEIAERDKNIQLIEASKEAEQNAIAIKVAAAAEKEAARDRAEAITTEAAAKQAAALAEAEGKRALNEAANTLSQTQIDWQVRMQLLQQLPEILGQAVRPMEKIESIRIVQVGGLGANGKDGSHVGSEGGNSNNGTFPEQVMNSALQYQVAKPVMDAVLKDVGLSNQGITGLAQNLAHLLEENKNVTSSQ